MCLRAYAYRMTTLVYSASHNHETGCRTTLLYEDSASERRALVILEWGAADLQ